MNVEPCSPHVLEGQNPLAIFARCGADGRSLWEDYVEVSATLEEVTEVGLDLRKLQGAVAELVRMHDAEHPQPTVRKPRSHAPRFRGGLGLTGATIIAGDNP